MLKNIQHKLREYRRWKNHWQLVRTGKIYHRHSMQIVVSKDELLNQLDDMDRHYNLMSLLVFGKEHKDYSLLLERVAVKFCFIGLLCYVDGGFDTVKPPVKEYIKRLFCGRYETPCEIKNHLIRMAKEGKIPPCEVTDEFVDEIFKRLQFVIHTCCPCMAQDSEVWWPNTYGEFISIASTLDIDKLPDLQKKHPLCPKTRTEVLNKLPNEMSERILKYINDKYNTEHPFWL